MNFLEACRILDTDVCADYIYIKSDHNMRRSFCAPSTGALFFGWLGAENKINAEDLSLYLILKDTWQVEYKLPDLMGCAHCGEKAEMIPFFSKGDFMIKCTNEKCSIQTVPSKDKHHLCRVWNERDFCEY